MIATRALAAGATVLLLWSLGCKKKEGEEQETEAEAQETPFEDARYRLKLVLPSGWTPAADLPPSSEGIKTLLDARRAPDDQKKFVVAPRVVVTSEATLEFDQDTVFRQTMEDLKSIGKKESVTVLRTSLKTRLVGSSPVGELEMSYRAGGDGAGKEVVHRSLVALRTLAEDMRGIVAITATYLATDEDRVAAEVTTMFQSLELYGDPAPAEPGVVQR